MSVLAAVALSWGITASLPESSDYVQSTWGKQIRDTRLRDVRDSDSDPFSESGGGPLGRVPPMLAWMSAYKGDQTEILAKPRWVVHVVGPRERMSQIAARYGISVTQLREDAKWHMNKVPTGKKLRFRARRIPPPREQVTHRVREGETWGSIAANYRVETPDLHSYNWKVEELVPGEPLTVWIDPATPWTVSRPGSVGARIIPGVTVPDGSNSVGRPNRGRLSEGLAIPDASWLYTLRDKPGMLFGSSHAIRQLVVAFTNMREDTGFEGQIVIGSMSRKRGGRFAPHRSHQSGRDADIRMPLLPGVPHTLHPNQDEIDWHATWALVKALLDTGEINAIFLETKLQRRLYEAARQLGATHEELADKITWPREPGKPKAIVRHSKGHDHHIHVRFSCGVNEPRCRQR